jgi:hypothetical protein
MTSCPWCRGRGRHLINCCCAYGVELIWVPCPLCQGEGKITEDRLERHREGRRMRDARVAGGFSQAEEAKRLGISVVELSQREFGR